jgi:6-phosphofructokinase 2
MITVTLNPALDISVEVERVEPERKLHGRHRFVEPGGGGVNVARVAAELGAKCTAAMLAGGPTGEQLLALLAEEGLATDAVRIAGATRESFTVAEASTGRQYRFVLPGPSVTDGEMAAMTRLLCSRTISSVLVAVSGSLPCGVDAARFAELLDTLRSAGARLVVDTSGPSLRAAAEVGTLLIKPSRRELAEAAGRALESEREIEAAARELLAVGPNRHIVVSLGAAGALLVSTETGTRRYYAPLIEVVSTVGAGDSLVGAMSVVLERGGDVVEAARWGVAAGTATTMSPGTGLCRRGDVERLLDDVGLAPTSSQPIVTAGRPPPS